LTDPKTDPQDRECRTKIVATLGPATSTYETIYALYKAGADCFRLNFSHGSHEDHAKSAAIIRKIQADTGADIGIMADMQGPKLRIGAFEGDKKIKLSPGMKIRFDLDPTPGDDKRVSFPHPDILKALEPGARFLMDDGNIGMTVAEKGEGYIVAEVKYGQELSSRKGVNVPDLSRHVDALTPKDRDDLQFALSLGVDWIAQSFVQSAEDVKEARDIINGRAKLIAKIEKPAAVKNFGEILPYIDAAMVARGDLGVEIPFEEVPGVQKYLIHACRAAGKPVVVATQMLDSMRDNPRPTRAEVSDVAQAVYDGASAVMLSGETSVGKYPALAVEAMDKICYTVEHGGAYTKGYDLPEITPRTATLFNQASKRPEPANDPALPAIWPPKPAAPGR
jgi:pyruvate kinase